jgi:hypothetical protein
MKITTVLAAVLIIVVGFLMIIVYDGHIIIVCTVCGNLITRVLGVISIVLGVASLVSARGGR